MLPCGPACLRRRRGLPPRESVGIVVDRAGKPVPKARIALTSDIPFDAVRILLARRQPYQ